MKKTLFIAMFIVAALVLASGQSYAVSGHCADCHTMHNSQNGAPVTGGAANAVLLKWDCLGCHTTGEADKNYGGIPRVKHTEGTALAGGNFNFIVNSASFNKGHNVVGLNGQDTNFTNPLLPPGGSALDSQLTCAGTTGCHGDRTKEGDMVAISGAHHTNLSGKLTSATGVGNSYRFLKGVMGIEEDTRENNAAGVHNEYYANTTNGISKLLCAGCHTTFHNNSESTGAWTRHPIDVALNVNATKDLSVNYVVGVGKYDPEVPLGRVTLPDAVSADAAAGDTVMCLSCHMAHASNYPDMLRWDYANIRAGENNKDGCNKCHAK